MRIGLLHGWLLEGSGSNVYVRELARALRARGHQVSVICQERRAERYGEIGAVCVPAIDKRLMPVHVADTDYEGFESVIGFKDLEGDIRLKAYLDDFTAGAAKFCRAGEIEVLIANHMYPMPVVASRIKELLNIPFLVFPHGSAIEYTLKKSEALARDAERAVEAADALVVGNETVTARIMRLYPKREESWRKKHFIVPVGVDPELFRPIAPGERKDALGRLVSEGLSKGGKTRAMTRVLTERACRMDQELIQAVRLSRSEYERKSPDADIASKFQEIDWAKEKILIFTGKLIAGKGLHDFIAALPAILNRRPDTRLLIVGEGPAREPLEMLLKALSDGDCELLERVLRLGGSLSEEPDIAFDNIKVYAERLGFEEWAAMGKDARPIEKVLFTGYLGHALYRHVLPCADIAVFPSQVAEAYPLVLIEAISAGVLPVASDFEGMGEGLSEISGALSSDIGELMRIKMDPETRIESMAENVGRLLERSADWAGTCRSLAEERYSWDKVAEGMETVCASVLGR